MRRGVSQFVPGPTFKVSYTSFSQDRTHVADSALIPPFVSFEDDESQKLPESSMSEISNGQPKFSLPQDK